MVDDAGLDQTAEFQHMMPVAPVTGQTGDLKAENRANRTGAQERHQPFETGPFGATAGGYAQIIIYDIDLCEPVSARRLNQIILPTLAFQVLHDLGLGGLADIDDRPPLQESGRQSGSMLNAHRSPPLARAPLRTAEAATGL